MLNEIKVAGLPKVESDAVGMLLACHQRIRNFTGIAVRLGEVTGASAAELANAAQSVHRYYTVALPLHEADENESVYPRLRRALADQADRRPVELMVEQHGPIDELVAQLVPLWSQVMAHPEKLAEIQGQLRAHAARLLELWQEHLSLEEEIVFPLIRARLAPEELPAIHREMKQRRGILAE